MLEKLHGSDRLEEVAEEIHSVLAPVGRTFRKMLSAFERDVGISPPKYFVLRILAEKDGISQGEIGRLFGVDSSRITRLAKVLESEGLIERGRDPEDNRVVRMSLTPEGRRVFELAYEKSKSFEERIGVALSEKEIEDLRRLLGAVAGAMDDQEGRIGE